MYLLSVVRGTEALIRRFILGGLSFDFQANLCDKMGYSDWASVYYLQQVTSGQGYVKGQGEFRLPVRDDESHSAIGWSRVPDI